METVSAVSSKTRQGVLGQHWLEHPNNSYNLLRGSMDACLLHFLKITLIRMLAPNFYVKKKKSKRIEKTHALCIFQTLNCCSLPTSCFPLCTASLLPSAVTARTVEMLSTKHFIYKIPLTNNYL